MKYLALIYADQAAWESFSPEEQAEAYELYGAFAEEARQAGVMVGGEELDSTTTATTVRVRGDETLVTDGPFVELKEALGGYFVFECGSMDEACAWAAKCPGAEHGTIEVRQVYDDEGGPS